MRSAGGSWRRCLLLGGLTALLSWLSYFPADAGFLGWVALVPLLLLVRAEAPRAARYAGAWLGGLGFFVPAISWMRVADDTMFVAWLALSLYCSLYFPLAVAVLRRLDERWMLPMTLTSPVVWTSLEFLRGWIAGGFPWYFLGHSQHDVLPLIQIADLGGALSVTFVVAAVNGFIADVISRGWAAGRRWATVPAILVLATLGYGGWRLWGSGFATGPTVALVQTNISQDLRNDAHFSPEAASAAAKAIGEELVRLMDRAAGGRPNLIVWPETTFPFKLKFAAPGATEAQLAAVDLDDVRWSNEQVAESGARWRTAVLLGIGCTIVGPGSDRRSFNSALLVSPAGVPGERYDKIHRVPFGEYVPFVEAFPWLARFTPYDGLEYSIAAGTNATRFRVESGGRDYTFGVLICYEDSLASLARRYVLGPRPVDFLVNISNDGWFRGTAEHEQHLAVSRFRAVECRRAVVRAVNMGISAVVDGNGRVTALPAQNWAASKGVSGVVAAAVPIDERTSLYVWAGDWLAGACLAVTVLGLLAPHRWLPTVSR